VARGTLLEFRSGTAIYYAPNTAGNRALVAALSKEKPLPKRTPRPLPPAPASPSPATILYERYIGLITPMIAHELEEAERIYPAEWLAEAFALAAERAKPHWRYVDGILRGWASDGKR
jgi:DnaD/phage-associated family protein